MRLPIIQADKSEFTKNESFLKFNKANFFEYYVRILALKIEDNLI